MKWRTSLISFLDLKNKSALFLVNANGATRKTCLIVFVSANLSSTATRTVSKRIKDSISLNALPSTMKSSMILLQLTRKVNHRRMELLDFRILAILAL